MLVGLDVLLLEDEELDCVDVEVEDTVLDELLGVEVVVLAVVDDEELLRVGVADVDKDDVVEDATLLVLVVEVFEVVLVEAPAVDDDETALLVEGKAVLVTDTVTLAGLVEVADVRIVVE